MNVFYKELIENQPIVQSVFDLKQIYLDVYANDFIQKNDETFLNQFLQDLFINADLSGQEDLIRIPRTSCSRIKKTADRDLLCEKLIKICKKTDREQLDYLHILDKVLDFFKDKGIYTFRQFHERYDTVLMQQGEEGYQKGKTKDVFKRYSFINSKEELDDREYFVLTINDYLRTLVEYIKSKMPEINGDEETVSEEEDSSPQEEIRTHSAIETFYEIAEDMKKEYGPLNINYAIALRNLGSAYKDSQKVTDAKKQYEKALGILRDHYSDRYDEICAVYRLIGILLKDNKDYLRAKDFFEDELKIRREHNKKTDEYTDALRTAAFFYKDSGDFEKAEEYFLEALKLLKSAYGDENKLVAKTYNELGFLYKDFGNNQKAMEMYEEELAIKKSILGESNPEYADAIKDIGFFFKDMHNAKKSEEYFKKALEIYKSNYGPEHDTTAMIYNNLGYLYKDNSEFKKAEEMFKKSSDIKKNLYGKNNTIYIHSLVDIGYYYKDKGDFKKSESTFNKAKNLLKAYAIDDTGLLNTINEALAFLYKDSGY